MFSIDSKDFTIASAARITVRDYSDYDSDLCHDGGHYATGVTFIRHPDGWERQEYTSGDYCPYCGSSAAAAPARKPRPQRRRG